jgi:hypothetical protein
MAPATGPLGVAHLAAIRYIMLTGSTLACCQGSEGPWRMMVLVGESRVAEHMSICPSAYKASHGVSLTVYMEEGVVLTDALH